MSMSDPGSASSSQGFRRLLPAVPAPSSSTDPHLSTQFSTRLPPRRAPVLAACNACRKRKIRCSGSRPVCDSCQKRNVLCEYETVPWETASQALKRKHEDTHTEVSVYKELFSILRKVPENEAQDITRRIRSGADPASVVQRFQSADLLLQLAVTPETRLRYEFPYIKEMPPSLIKDNPYLDSIIYESTCLYSNHAKRRLLPNGAAGSRLQDPQSNDQSPYLKPIHAAEVIEPRLTAAKPSLWTGVCSDDALMRELLGFFFRSEYSYHCLFQKDLFLEDLISQKTDFCSSLLVNAVLAYSCVCYSEMKNRGEYWNPSSLSYRFLAETRRLWELEAEVARVTTIQAGTILTNIYAICGLDKIGRAYSLQSIVLADKLGLFEHDEKLDKRTRDGREFTAWMLFMFETTLAYHFMHSPLITQPPKALPPPSVNTHWYGEIIVRYPLSESRWPIHFGDYFRARCCLFVIINKVCQAAFAEDAALTLEQANNFHIRMKDWYRGLPQCLKPRYIFHPNHFQLHFYYFNLLTTIYEPFTAATGQELPPQNFVSEATKYIHTLIRIYYLRHSFQTTDVFLTQPLALVGFACLRLIGNEIPEANLEVARGMLFLVTKGLHDQGRSFHVAETVYRVIQGQMRPEEATLMERISRMEEGSEASKQSMLQAVHSSWPVSVVSKTGDLEMGKLTRLVKQFVITNLSTREDEDKELDEDPSPERQNHNRVGQLP